MLGNIADTHNYMYTKFKSGKQKLLIDITPQAFIKSNLQKNVITPHQVHLHELNTYPLRTKIFA
jgi:hypothetical protein